MIKAARLEWDRAIAIQAECEELIQTHDPLPGVLIRKLMLDVKIEGARVLVNENGNALRVKRPNPYKRLNLDFVNKYIKGVNTKHSTMFTLPGTLLEGFGYIDDVTSFLLIAKNKGIVELSERC